MNFPRNPINKNAITMAEVRRDTSFMVVNAGRVVMQGTFTGGVEYTEEDGWPNIPVNIKNGAEAEISPYDTGIVCQPNGKWQTDIFVLDTKTSI